MSEKVLTLVDIEGQPFVFAGQYSLGAISRATHMETHRPALLQAFENQYKNRFGDYQLDGYATYKFVGDRRQGCPREEFNTAWTEFQKDLEKMVDEEMNRQYSTVPENALYVRVETPAAGGNTRIYNFWVMPGVFRGQ